MLSSSLLQEEAATVTPHPVKFFLRCATAANCCGVQQREQFVSTETGEEGEEEEEEEDWMWCGEVKLMTITAETADEVDAASQCLLFISLHLCTEASSQSEEEDEGGGKRRMCQRPALRAEQ